MAKYLIMAGVLSTPNDAYYQGQEVEAADLGVDQPRIDHLLAQGAIEEVADDDKGGKGKGKASTETSPPPPPATVPPETTGTGTGVQSQS